MTGGVIRIQSAAATVRDFTILPPTSGNKATPFSTSGTGYLGWRITNIKYDCTGSSFFSYFIYVGGNYGLIDHCTINGGGGTNELIFARGTSDSWQTPSSMGTQDALFVEDCTFGGQGYVCDINDNGRAVFRYNTITTAMKIDGHGYASNSKRGVRHMEVYGNHWTAAAGTWAAIELRGGTGMVFDNICDNVTGISVKSPSLSLKEYGCLSLWPNFGNLYQTPLDYPVKDQIGAGMDPLAAGSEPMYLWNNVRAGSDWGVSAPAIPSAAITYYQTLTADLTASFTMNDVVQSDRDYFKQTVGLSFDGSGSVGRGTKSQMLAIQPSKKGVGFWVTDEASWNKSGGAQGQLYTWSGSAWTLRYTPYTYPHPLQGSSTPSTTLPAPTITVKAN
jgi:hypothetical protein